ncbi:MAG TPA: TadE/TadG family type IV pilus assembly protein [Roseiarcus sp.]|jgi:Flp pilus assembly protein TadG
MIFRRFTCDRRGVAAVEFAITSPVYFLALFGLAQAGLWLWADFSLQRAADAASRWAAIQCGPKLATCPTDTQLQSYAVTNLVGLSVPSSAFSLSTAAASCSGALVTAAYGVPTFTSGLGLPNITVHASACYPI